VERNLLLLVPALRARGLEPAVALLGDGPLRDRLRALGVATASIRLSPRLRRAGRYGRTWRSPSAGRHALGASFPGAVALVAAGLPAALRLAALARRTRADLIHASGTKANLLGGLAGRLARVPVVWHLHDFPPEGLAGRAFRRAAGWLPAVVVACSHAGAEALGSPAFVVPNPVDLSRFRPGLPADRLRDDLALRGDQALVGMAAHLTPWKGHALFLEIARAVLEAGAKAHFVVAGGAIYETEGHAGYAEGLHRRAAALGLSERVAFLGAREDVPEILAGLDVLVHCPVAPEAFGRVLAEAMAVGRPVVAARCGGIPEVVEDGVTGLLVEPGDVAGFAGAVLRLLGDQPLREEMGRAGRRRAGALFGVDRHVEGVLRAYGRVLGEGAVRQ
jgi:glycosyltransferase involved in cell wall biosynthesis